MRVLAQIRGFAWLAGPVVALTLAMVSLVAQPVVTVVTTELDNPRGLAMGPEGALYVAEAGRGGPGLDPCGLNSPARRATAVERAR